MGHVVFADNGYVVHRPNPEQDVDYGDRGAGHYDARDFAGRIPVVVKGRDLYVGRENWYHDDTAGHHGFENQIFSYPQGYFQGGHNWGNGNLSWYGQVPDEHPQIAQALQKAGYDIPNPEHPGNNNYMEEELWNDELHQPPEYHHPLDEQDEWR